MASLVLAIAGLVAYRSIELLEYTSEEVLRDATQERAAQNAMRLADRRKDEFLATLAHELRNPLAPIRRSVALAALLDVDAMRIAQVLGNLLTNAAKTRRRADRFASLPSAMALTP